MKRYIIFFAVIGIVSFLWAVIWPISYEYAVNGFGLLVQGTLNRGIEFRVQNAPVSAPADGEVVFECSESTLSGGFPVPEGSMLVYKSQGDILTIYTGLLTVSTILQNPQLKEHDLLGMTQNVPGVKAYAYVFDLKNSMYLHPHHIFPVVKETSVPQIRTVMLYNETGEIQFSQIKNIKQGNWYLKCKAMDPVTSAYNDGIKKITFLLDGMEKHTITLDTIAVKNGKLVFQANNSWSSDVVDSNGFLILGPVYITKGKSIITLVLEDFYGNEKSYSWPLLVE